VPPSLSLSLAFDSFTLFPNEMTFRLFLLFLIFDDFSEGKDFPLQPSLFALSPLSLVDFGVFVGLGNTEGTHKGAILIDGSAGLRDHPMATHLAHPMEALRDHPMATHWCPRGEIPRFTPRAVEKFLPCLSPARPPAIRHINVKTSDRHLLNTKY